MKLFLSIFLGSMGLGAIMMFFMGAVFAGGAFANNAGLEGTSIPAYVDIIIFSMLWVVPLILCGFHVYGQRLWWSKERHATWLSVLYMLSGFPALVLLIIVVFIVLPSI